eukprot:1150229-Pelagomonas_calceolata.AAC.1
MRPVIKAGQKVLNSQNFGWEEKVANHVCRGLVFNGVARVYCINYRIPQMTFKVYKDKAFSQEVQLLACS